jgi:hypothetical protein
MSPGLLFRHDVLVAIGGWRLGSKLEDYDVLLRVSSRGPFAYDSVPTSAWRQHSKNTSRATEMMFNETISAQHRIADELGFNETKRREIRATTYFTFADYFLRAGQRGRAARMSLEGIRGAPSLNSVVRRAIRLMVPSLALRLREDYLARQARRQVGALINPDGSISN